jgi:hypothetical protein
LVRQPLYAPQRWPQTVPTEFVQVVGVVGLMPILKTP